MRASSWRAPHPRLTLVAAASTATHGQSACLAARSRTLRATRCVKASALVPFIPLTLRAQFVLSTKVGRYGSSEFDFSAARVTASVEARAPAAGVLTSSAEAAHAAHATCAGELGAAMRRLHRHHPMPRHRVWIVAAGGRRDAARCAAQPWLLCCVGLLSLSRPPLQLSTRSKPPAK